jgi:hypothetical protein
VTEDDKARRRPKVNALDFRYLAVRVGNARWCNSTGGGDSGAMELVKKAKHV